MEEKILKQSRNGLVMLLLLLLLYAAAVLGAIACGICLDQGDESFPVIAGMVVSLLWICLGWIGLCGLKVIKPQEAEALAAEAWAVHKKEEGQIAGILSGKGFPRPFVDATLEQLGVEYVD